MTHRTTLAILAAAALAAPFAAQAADDVSTGSMPVIGSVAAICAATPLAGGGEIFDVGMMIDTTTGFLRPDLSAPPKTLTASFCNTRSVVSISASRMTAQSATGTPPAGFANGVDFTAAASGWTEAPAVFATGAASNPQASQSRGGAHAGDIVVSLSNFATQGGPALRPVADSEYRGQVVVTLGVAD